MLNAYVAINWKKLDNSKISIFKYRCNFIIKKGTLKTEHNCVYLSAYHLKVLHDIVSLL